jgi:hypothetical protein
MDVTAVRRGLAFGADGATVRRATPGGGTDAAPLLAHVPADAVAVVGAASAAELATVAAPFRAALGRGLGVPFATLAAAAPSGSVLYVRAGAPVPGTTVVGEGGSAARLRAVADALGGGNVISEPTTLDGRPATLVSLSALQLWYGLGGRTAFLTDDAGFHLDPSSTLAPDGLPDAVASFVYLDVARGIPALSDLAALAGTRVSERFRRRVAGLATVLTYRTHTAAATRITVVVG